MKRKVFMVLLVGITCVLAGCVGPKPAGISDAQVVQDVDQFLLATQTDDYQTSISNFSSTMKSSYSQGKFESVRGLLSKASGRFGYCSNEKPGLTDSKGYAVYTITCLFALENVTATVSYKIGGTQIEGLYFSSTGLLNLTK